MPVPQIEKNACTQADHRGIIALLEGALNDLAIASMVNGRELSPEVLNQLADTAERHVECKPFADAARTLARRANDALPGVSDDAIQQLQDALQMLSAGAPGGGSHQGPPEIAPACAHEEEDLEMLAGFVAEAGEHLTEIEAQALVMEKEPGLLEPVHTIFRGFHTLKGLAGFLGLHRVQDVAHHVETLLDHARNGRVTPTSELVDTVLESADFLRAEVNALQARLLGNVPAELDGGERLIARVHTFTQQALIHSESDADALPCSTPSPRCTAAEREGTSAQNNAAAASLQTQTEVQGEEGDGKEQGPAPTKNVWLPRCSEELVPQTGPPIAAANTGTKATDHRPEGQPATIRIDTAKLDLLMDLVGEMVIAQTILAHNPSLLGGGDARLAGDLSHLARITGDVQRRVMSMRMMPIGPLFQKNAKLVRDLSRRQGKNVGLVLTGEGTELDKAIAEELADPLLHMIRNAIDHGIETPEERVENGKPATATLHLSAEHQSGHIVISIADDGRGLDPEKILNKAREKGLVPQGVPLAEEDIFQLIFAPGFSTAEALTDLSGRGVGMDVVRKHVENLRGDIQIRSEAGKGTTFFLHLPLTLAIIEGLVIVVGKHRYIIPVFSVREILRPRAEMVFTVQGREETVLIRGRLLPLVRLHRRFGIEPRSENVCQGLLVVCEAAGRQFALHVDDLVGRQEVVIKSLGSTFQHTTGFSGCAVLGDGQISLILDVGGVYRMPNAGPERNGS